MKQTLEDERIERQVCQEFAGVRWVVRRLSHVLYDESQPIDERSDSAGVVVAYFLQLRWARRLGQLIPGSLSRRNHEFWQRMEPLGYGE